MSVTSLTPKQVIAFKEHISGKGPTEAYETAYNTENMQRLSINREAFRLLREHPIIAPMVDEAKKRMAESGQVTAETILEELEEARQKALEVDQVGAAVSASAHKAKLLGLNAPEKREQVNIDGTPQDLSRKVETARKALDKPAESINGESGIGLPIDHVEPASDALTQPTNGSGTTEPHKAD